MILLQYMVYSRPSAFETLKSFHDCRRRVCVCVCVCRGGGRGAQVGYLSLVMGVRSFSARALDVRGDDFNAF